MTHISLTPIQRGEIGHLLDICEGELTMPEQHDAEGLKSYADAAIGFRSLLDGVIPTGELGELVISELEWHKDKFAPTRPTWHSDGDPGERSVFASMNALLRKIKAAA